jgi:hypothetical protein
LVAAPSSHAVAASAVAASAIRIAALIGLVPSLSESGRCLVSEMA